MQTREQVRLERIGYHVAQYAALDAQNGNKYADRLTKARALVVSGTIRPTNRDGYYRVQGSQAEPYYVNGACDCEDYRQHVVNNLHYWCKHKIACRLYKLVEADLAARTPHVHRYRCGHAEGNVQCWDSTCESSDIEHPILCLSCEDALCLSKDLRTQEALEHDSTPNGCEPSCLACATEEAGETLPDAMCDSLITTDALLDAAPELSPLNYRAILEDTMYAPNPTPSGQEASSTRAPLPPAQPPQAPLPEAPVSLNIKRPLQGGGELMLTLRGYDEQDVLARYERIVDRLARHLPERCTRDAGDVTF